LTPSSWSSWYQSCVTDREPPSEERAIYVALAVVGAVLVAAALATRGAPDAGATFGLAFVVLALIGLTSQLRGARRERLPDAHARRRR
jgi:hypothetical protein